MAALDFHEALAEVSLENPEDPTVALDQIPVKDSPAKVNPTCRFFLEGRCHFGARCQNPHPAAANGAHHLDVHKTAAVGSPKMPSGKKPPMKTAEDVISRILWDNQIPAEHFSVGYLDRFLGVLEEPFGAFSWEDLASAGPGVLAIPKHRIQYFKYKDCVVWDKASRTDNIFGSTGGRTTILEVIKKAEADEAIKEKEDLLTKDGEKGMGALHSGQDGDGGSTSEWGKHLERTRGEVVVQGAEAAVDGLKSIGDSCTILDEDGSREEYVASRGRIAEHFPHPKQRPTHFIAVHVTSPEIRASVQLLQGALCDVRPDLDKFCVPLGALHLTLCLLRLDTPAEIHKAVVVLQELQANSQRLLPPALLISFHSVETFHSHVLYLSPASVLELGRLAHTLENAFCRKGLMVVQPPNKETFHMTIVKIPPKESELQLPADTSWLPAIEDLGTQAVEALYLCEAGRGRRTDGFYTTVLKIGLY